jgi:predicted dithiol-disulfide oxidoreductase (DUF899 family)
MQDDIARLENQIFEMCLELQNMRAKRESEPVRNYTFVTEHGETDLLRLFGDKEGLFAIHNMGQSCRYCTLWADGLNGFLEHLESEFAVVLLSKDPPDVQRRLANNRKWRFNLASHAGGDYIREQTVVSDQDNSPGIVYYERRGDEIFVKNRATFGPNDLFCSIWPILGLAGRGTEGDWTPQFAYWSRPRKLEDGGQDIQD